VRCRRLINRHESDNRVSVLLRRALSPIAIITSVLLLRDFIAHQINISGAFSALVDITVTVLLHAAAIWLFWLLIRALFERIVKVRNIPDNSFNAHLWRPGGRTVGTVIGIVIVGRAAQKLPPLYSVISGLGIDGPGCRTGDPADP